MKNDEINYDSDPMDCNDYRAKREFDVESADEFITSPAEFDSYEDDTQNENDNQPVKNFFNAPGIIAPLGTNIEYGIPVNQNINLSSLYESGQDNDFNNENPVDKKTTRSSSDDCGCGDDCDCTPTKRSDDCGCGDKCDCEHADDNIIPQDETAATCDENSTINYNDDCNCGCTPNRSVDTCDCIEPTAYAQEKCKLDDYEIASDILGDEKELVKLYSTALCESSEERLRNVIKNNLVEVAEDQYAVFEYMYSRGMYPTKQATSDKILKAKQTFCPLCDRCCD